MTTSLFRILLWFSAIAFTVIFAVLIVPPLLEDFDVIGAFAAGFVNPFSSGYSIDVIVCWFILAIWIIHDAQSLGVRHGWWCLLMGVVPGVAVGFAAYLLIRQRQVRESAAN